MAFSFDFGGLVGALMQSQQQAAATQLGYENLNFQKQLARDQKRLTTAPRTDAYGNKQSFDDLLGEWLLELTPTQRGLVSAGEKEQKLSLTEDAQRNRQTRRRQESRALEATEDFEDARTGYRYDQPEDEEAIMGRLAPLLASSREDAIRTGGDIAARGALRQGQNLKIPGLVKAIDDRLGSGLNDIILKARSGAMNEAQSKRAAHESRYGNAMNMFARLMDAVGASPQLFSNTPNEMSQLQAQMLQMMMQQMGQEGASVGNAYANLAQLMSQSPNLAGLFTGSFGDGGGAGKTTASKTLGTEPAGDPNMYTWDAMYGRFLPDNSVYSNRTRSGVGAF